jgi:putative ABC transport system ATP-binding protein
METVLRVESLTKTYPMGEVHGPALRGIDLALGTAELVVLLGASGSGKSTLLNIMGGLDIPTSGRVVYRDRDITAADERTLTAYRRDHVGFVFQFYNLVPNLTARENVALVTDLAESPIAPEEALQMVGMDHRSIISRPSSRAASSSASRLQEQLPNVRRCCSVTSRPVRSTCRPVRSYSKPLRE